MRYSDGGTFVGDAVEMVRHGYGIRTWPDGQTYTGTYNNGKEIEGRLFIKGQILLVNEGYTKEW